MEAEAEAVRTYWKRKQVVFKTVKLKQKWVNFKVIEAKAETEAASFKKLEVEVEVESMKMLFWMAKKC